MKKILVIQNKRIGDVLLASLIAENIKKVYSNATVHFMVYDYTSGVIENHPTIDAIIEINDKELKKIPTLIKTALEVRKSKYDIIFDPYAKFQSKFICYFSKAKKRVGYKKKNKKSFFNFYTDHVEFLKEKSLPCGKSLEDRVHLVKSVFPVETPTYEPKIFLTDIEQQYDKLVQYKKPVVMFGVLGSTPQKTMPHNYIVELIDFVTKNYDVSVLFNYAPHQKEDAKSIYEKCKHKDQIIFDIYEESIRGFVKLMNKCKLLIANEGGTVHIAKALHKPTFTIFSPYVLKEHWGSFEDGKMHDSIHLLDEKPDLFSIDRKERRKIESDPSFMYNQLSPEIMIPKLDKFLKNHF